MSTFATAILNPECALRFYVYIQGIPDVFLDGEVPVGPLGAAWSAPSSFGFAYTLRPYLLDVSGGVRDVGADVSRRTATTDPGSLTLRFADVNRDNFLRGLFARDLSTAFTAQLMADLAYNTAAAGATLQVDSTTGWPASGHAYLGGETIYYSSKTATTLVATNASGGHRDLYSIGHEDTVFRLNANAQSGPRIISTSPRIWHGRYVRLFAYVVDQDGRAYDSAFGGVYGREVFRGVVQGSPRLETDWRSWLLELRSIDAILATNVGRDPIEGMLIRVPGNAKQNAAGKAGFGPWQPQSQGTLYLLDDNTRFLDLEIIEYANFAAYQAGTIAAGKQNAYTLTLSVAGTVQTFNTLTVLIDSAIDTAIAATYPSLTIQSSAYASKHFQAHNADAAKFYKVTLNFAAQGSVGRLRGFSSTVAGVVAPMAYHYWYPSEPLLSAYISAESASIPFCVVSTNGQQPDAPTAPGYVRIGEEEIVYYTGISDYGQYLEDMKVLTGCQRGTFGSKPKEHMVQIDPDWNAIQDQVKVTFGVGFDNISLFDAFRQLATSTGGGHHGTYDVLGEKISVALNPHHFDNTAIDALRNALAPSVHTISYFMSKPHKLTDLLSDWLAPLGCFVSSRVGASGLFRITIDRVTPALESENALDVDTAGISVDDPVQWRSGNDRLINEIATKYRWNFLKEEAADASPAVWIDHDSAYDYKQRNRVEWTLRGYPWTPGDANSVLPELCKAVTDRYGHPYDVVEVRVDRRGWLVSPGQTVRVTIPGMPGPDGAEGINARSALVIGVRNDYWTPGEDCGATLVLLLERYVRQSTYAPAAKVSAYNGAGPTITLTTNYYSPTGGTAIDADFFVNGDIVRIWNQGDASTFDVRTLSAKNGSDFTLSGALINCVPGANTYLTHADYSVVQASQRQRAFIADNSAKGALTVVETTGFKYV